MMRFTLTVWMLLALFVRSFAAEEASLLKFTARARVEPASGGELQVVDRPMAWAPAQTAAVICDMWDRHWCRGATERVAEMAPRMNQVLRALRDRGVLIIHCPSETMGFYKEHPGRKLGQSAPKVDVKALMQSLAGRVRQQDPPHPLDASDGGCDDEPRCVCPPMPPFPWQRQIAALEIKDGDVITDNLEAYYVMRQRGITNVLIMGVHENMCVLNRSFAIKQMVKLGQNVVLLRDLTDTMYNSRRRPFVNHFAGNDLMTAHIELYWCPTVTSAAFLEGRPFRFGKDTRPRVALVIGEDECDAKRTVSELRAAE